MAGRGIGLARLGVATLLAALALAAPAAAQADAAADRAWVQHALALQYELADDVGLANVPWISTHNSFNSQAEMGPTLSAQDPNQQISIVDQLEEGVRHLELDPHFFVSPTDPRVGLEGPVVCHATGEDAGCTTEKPLIAVMRQIRDWLDAHRDQVVMIYFDTALDSPAEHDATAEVLEETVGERLWRPPSRGAACDPLPLELTRAQILAAGKQVLMFAPCGQGAKWPSVVFDERRRITGGDNTAIRAFPDCGPDFTRKQYDGFPTRYFEDATRVGGFSGTADPLTPELTERMSRCGVDIIAMDNLLRGDVRLDRLVWSWARGEPTRPEPCAVQRGDGRWESRVCRQRHRVACRRGDGSWFVPPGLARARAAPRLCETAGNVNAVPRTAFDGQQLAVAQRAAGAPTVWLGHRWRRGRRWTRFERAGCGPELLRPQRRRRVRRGVASFVVRLRAPCTGERFKRRLVVRGGKRTVRRRTGRRIRVRVARRTRRLTVRYRYRGRPRGATVLLRRR